MGRAGHPTAGTRAPLALARAWSGLGEFERAAERARAALELAASPEEETPAHAELGFARSRLGDPGPEVEEAVVRVRRFLGERPRGPLAEPLRIRLCHTRGSLPAAHPLSLAAPPSFPPGREPIDFEEAGDALTRPRKIFAPPPPYAASALGVRSAEAESKTIIDVDGCVHVLETRASAAFGPGHVAAIEETMTSLVFEPALAGEEPVAVTYTLSVKLTTR